MARLLGPLGIMILGVCAQAGVLGQDPEQRCPKLEVVGPSGVVLPGDQATFSINIPEVPALRYQWTVTAGAIESGQGSPVIFVRTSEEDDGVELRASVTITGLASDCRSAAEGSVLVQQGGHPPKLDRYQGLALPDELARLDSIVQKRRGFSSAGALYFFLSRSPNDSEVQLEHRKEAIRNRLMDRWGIPSSEIVFVFVDREFSTVFLVPFRKTGERPSDPKDRATATTECPTIMVTGPAGIVEPGRTIHFSVSLEPEDPSQPLGFEWEVSGGTIVGRQDVRTLEVRPRKYFNEATTATVKIRELPEGCVDTASDFFQVVCDPYLVTDASFWTQYFEVSWPEERKHLDSLVLEGLKRHPGHAIYLEKSFAKDASQKHVNTRIHQIRNYLNIVRRIPKNRFFIRTSRGNRDRTNGYLVPRDAPVLDPNYSEPCFQ